MRYGTSSACRVFGLMGAAGPSWGGVGFGASGTVLFLDGGVGAVSRRGRPRKRCLRLGGSGITRSGSSKSASSRHVVFQLAVFAASHTQMEWESAKNEGKLAEMMEAECPAGKDFFESKKFKTKYESHLYDFVYDFASDSGNIPSC